MDFKGGMIKKTWAGFSYLKTSFAFQKYTHTQKRVGLALIILIIALVVFLSYFLFFYVSPVSSVQEFVDALTRCKKVSWVREDIQANWLYIIKGNAEEDTCEIEIQLLKIKKGTVNNEILEGKKMTCVILKNEIILPEKDISRCTGELKEELQNLIIQKMHNYLLKGLGGENEEFEGFENS